MATDPRIDGLVSIWEHRGRKPGAEELRAEQPEYGGAEAARRSRLRVLRLDGGGFG